MKKNNLKKFLFPGALRFFTLLVLSQVLILSISYSLDAATEIDSIDRYIEESRKSWEVPGIAVAIIKDGEIILSQGYGNKKLELLQVMRRLNHNLFLLLHFAHVCVR